MNAESYVKAKLVELAWQEASHYGGIANMEAVLYIVRNRQQAGWRNGDWLEIIEHYGGQYATEPFPVKVDLRDYRFQQLLRLVDNVFDGSSPDRLTDGALYAAELSEDLNPVFRDTVVREPAAHPRCAVVGPVYFWR